MLWHFGQIALRIKTSWQFYEAGNILLPLIAQAHHFEHYWRCCSSCEEGGGCTNRFCYSFILLVFLVNLSQTTQWVLRSSPWRRTKLAESRCSQVTCWATDPFHSDTQSILRMRVVSWRRSVFRLNLRILDISIR